MTATKRQRMESMSDTTLDDVPSLRDIKERTTAFIDGDWIVDGQILPEAYAVAAELEAYANRLSEQDRADFKSWFEVKRANMNAMSGLIARERAAVERALEELRRLREQDG
jgi:hypothetical protein